jgi:hypothetical protein
MTELFRTVGNQLFSEKYRHHLSFRQMTIFVSGLHALALIVRLFAKLPPEMVATYSKAERIVYAPVFLLLFNAFVAAGFFFVYSTRRNERYYRLRVIAFGMLLSGLMGEMLILLLPWTNGAHSPPIGVI